MPFLPPLISKLFSTSNAPSGDLPTDVLRCVERGAAKDLAALQLPEHVFFQCASYGSGQPTVWHIAAERGDVEVINQLHTAYSSLPNTTPSSSPNNSRSPVKAYCVQDKQGRTPLMVACQHGNVQCAAALISWGADASKERDRRGRLPIHLVAQAGRLDLLQLLLGLSGPSLQPSPPPGPQPQTLPRVPSRKGEEASSRTTSAPTPAGIMSNSGGQTGGGGSLSPSSQQTAPQQMPNKTLSQQQRITDYSRYMACAVDECGLTPLHYAAASNSLPVCQLLLDCGANVAAVSSVACYDNLLPCNAGMTPLHIAAMSNSFKVAHLMLTVWNMQSLEEKVQNWSPSSSPAPNSKGLAGDNDSIRKNYGGSNGVPSNGGDGDGSRKRALPTQAAGGITDPRTILDKERKAAYMLAYASSLANRMLMTVATHLWASWV
ncbi:hypothetical protein CEUSTIGMA_g12628.t1 [Chlamydomonas eustigma]|uniref:Uncharacterized protein n=1 Tax=Chlamydomonas eustigma TaxID=1157962 RepID=A0A250XQ64_9CHLO|nr:hypothetical protein CEUSTIGMA_g12628.t1 [Chlamydomonas eustigma]|eukprot:GAX85208.1 hypothetical protein CEUSTIGMA_g12628.t1 [Chlamydomonas eustigma]